MSTNVTIEAINNRVIGSRMTSEMNCFIADKMKLLNIKTMKKTIAIAIALIVEVATSSSGHRPITVQAKLSVFRQSTNINLLSVRVSFLAYSIS